MEEQLPCRTPDFKVWQGLEVVDSDLPTREVEFEDWGELDAEFGTRSRLKGRWRGDRAAIVILAAIAIFALAFQPWAPITIPVVTTLAFFAILKLRQEREPERQDPAQPGGHAAGQGAARPPPGA